MIYFELFLNARLLRKQISHCAATTYYFAVTNGFVRNDKQERLFCLAEVDLTEFGCEPEIRAAAV
jgi:hypothetical protein